MITFFDVEVEARFCLVWVSPNEKILFNLCYVLCNDHFLSHHLHDAVILIRIIYLFGFMHRN